MEFYFLIFYFLFFTFIEWEWFNGSFSRTRVFTHFTYTQAYHTRIVPTYYNVQCRYLRVHLWVKVNTFRVYFFFYTRIIYTIQHAGTRNKRLYTSIYGVIFFPVFSSTKSLWNTFDLYQIVWLKYVTFNKLHYVLGFTRST